jgi:LL-diaminopimelate aminotransferase
MKRKVVIGHADRIDSLSSPFLEELQAVKRSAVRRGQEIFDLSRFSLHIPPPVSAVGPASRIDTRRVFAEYLARRDNVRIDPEREILLLPSGRTALMLLCTYLVESGRECYVPDPGFVAFRNLPLLFGATVKRYPLYQRNEFLPNLDQLIDGRPGVKKLKLLFLNSPHNPTGAVCDRGFYTRLERFAAEQNMLLIVDSSYCLSARGSFQPPIFMEYRKRLQSGLELFSLSTNLCAPDLKLTLLVGHRRLIGPLESLARLTGLFPCTPSVNMAGSYMSAVDGLEQHVANCRHVIAESTGLIAQQLDAAGIDYHRPLTSPFVWVRLKRGRVSISFARSLLRRKGVAVAPGSSFGEEGEGWVRIAGNLTGSRLQQAIELFVKHFLPLKTRLRRRS